MQKSQDMRPNKSRLLFDVNVVLHVERCTYNSGAIRYELQTLAPDPAVAKMAKIPYEKVSHHNSDERS